jgi:arylsulfatase A-like enzyme
LLGKQSMYEHSMKAPLMIVGPDIPQDKQLSMPVYIQDFVATALELAKVEKPDHVEFKSLLPLIRGERAQQYPVIYGAYEMNKQRMIRKDELKLIYYPHGEHYLMFNVVNDPQEQINLVDHPEYSQQIASLKMELQALMKRMDDPMLATAQTSQ